MSLTLLDLLLVTRALVTATGAGGLVGVVCNCLARACLVFLLGAGFGFGVHMSVR